MEDSGLLRANLSLELYNPSPVVDAEFRARMRKPGILILQFGDNFLFALYQDAVKTEYDPTTQRYRLHFISLLDALRAYLSKDKWWNVLDAATLMASFRDFLAQYLPESLVNDTAYLPDSMSPMQEDPKDPSWPHFAGFIQPASWLVGKEVGIWPLSPWTIISVLGVAKSIVQEDTIFALCLAKPNGWWPTVGGDYVWPMIVKATWNAETWDWDFVSGYWHRENEDLEDPLTWSYPVWFGMKQNLPGKTGESALIYTTATPEGERVVCAWTESPTRKPGLGPDPERGFKYVYYPNMRAVLLDGDLSLLDQKKIQMKLLSAFLYSPEAVILRGGGYADGTNLSPAGVIFVGINGLCPVKGASGYGESGQDGISAVCALRWNDDAWTDSFFQILELRFWVMNDPGNDDLFRLICLEPFALNNGGPGNCIGYTDITLNTRATLTYGSSSILWGLTWQRITA